MRITQLVAAWLLPVLLSLPLVLAADESQWRKLPPLPGRTDYTGPIALEGDTLWATGGNSTVYWTGSEWRVPPEKLLKGGQYLTQFFGGQQRPLLFSQRGEKDHEGELYRLRDGHASLLTTFHYDRTTSPPSIGVTAGGDVFSISSRGIAVFHAGAWQTTPSPKQLTAVFPADDAIYFYDAGARRLIRFHADSGFHEQQVDLALTKTDAVAQAAQCGPDRVLVMEHGQPGLRGFLLGSGREFDAGKANDVIGKLRPTALRRRRDGSVWVLCQRPGEPRSPLFCLRPTGECEPASELEKVDWNGRARGSFPGQLVEARDGAIWIAGQQETLTRIADGRITRFGSETGYDLSHCSQLLEDSRGTMYAAGISGIYAWPSSSSVLRDLPAPRVPSRPDTTWVHRCEKQAPLVRAWKQGKTIYAISKHPMRIGHMLIALDAASGRTLFSKDLPNRGNFSPPWLFHESDNGVLQFSVQGKVLRLSNKTGDVQEEIDLPHDERIPPVPVADGFIVVPGNRSRELVRVDGAQKPIWRKELPGYVQLHPTVIGKHVLVQTRGGGYGGQQTLCIRLDDGALVWQDETNAYGTGIDYFDDERFLIDANTNLTPQIGEGLLIARNPADGTRIWEYRRSGLLHHPPIVDRRTGRVYAVFQRGEVFCLRGDDGSVVWTQRLSENAFPGGAADSYQAAWSPHTLYQGRFYVVDQCLTLHALDAATGEFKSSISLVPQTEMTPRTKVELVGAPWIEGEQVFAALSVGVVSLRLP